jgi:hypothetical protein
MRSTSLTQTQESLDRLAGTWTLGAGHAISLRPAEPGTVRVAEGRVWVTYDGPHGRTPSDSGDHIVSGGAALPLAAGERLVMEAWNGGRPVRFSWEPAPAPQPVEAARWTAVTQPLADLRLALVFGLGAFGRLLAGLARLGVSRALPRRRRPARRRDRRAGQWGRIIGATAQPWPAPSPSSTTSSAKRSWTSPRSASPSAATRPRA